MDYVNLLKTFAAKTFNLSQRLKGELDPDTLIAMMEWFRSLGQSGDLQAARSGMELYVKRS